MNKEYRALFLIAVFKLIKGSILLVLGINLLLFFNDSNVIKIESWLEFRDIAPNISLDPVYEKIDFVSKHKHLFSYGSIFYSTLFFIEGFGLIAKKRWAEYFTLIITVSLVPFEIYELIKKFSFIKISVISINFAIVVYLYKEITNKKKNQEINI